MRSNNDQDRRKTRLTQGTDHMLQDATTPQRQSKLGSSHACALAGGRNQGGNHERTGPTGTHSRASRIVPPRLRQAINSATILTAISATVCEPMSKPRGACTFRKASSEIPRASTSSKMRLILRLLPITPT